MKASSTFVPSFALVSKNWMPSSSASACTFCKRHGCGTSRGRAGRRREEDVTKGASVARPAAVACTNELLDKASGWPLYGAAR